MNGTQTIGRDTRPNLTHLTYTGVHAGSYLCLAYWTELGAGSIGERREGDRGVHLAYAPEWTLTDDATCADCRHVVECGNAEVGVACLRCQELGYTNH